MNNDVYEQAMKNGHDLEYEKSICYQEGREEGRRENALSNAKNLLAEGISPETVARCVGITLEEVKALNEIIMRYRAGYEKRLEGVSLLRR